MSPPPNHNVQVEKSWLDGTKEIRFPDGTVKTISPNGESVSQFADGVVVRELRDGTRQINTGPDLS